MKLIKNGEVFAPDSLGRQDILVGGGKILALGKNINPGVLPGDVAVIDANGMFVVPGFIDGHQHFTGGGGEAGFQSKTAEMSLSMNITAGVTTAVGLLGTDCLTRSVENLYAKTQAFNAEGMTALMLTGSYWLPSSTICGSVSKDITFLDPVVGVKLAMADQRGPSFDTKELAVLASDVRMAALIASKPGIITVHTGVNPEGLDQIFDCVAKYAIRSDIFIPTHINRKKTKVSDQALQLAGMGGFIDATCLHKTPAEDSQHMSAADYACLADENDVFDRICFSSDAGGSLPKWNEDMSRVVGMGVGNPESLLVELKRLVSDREVPLHKALWPLTVTPAKVYGLEDNKGKIKVGFDADLLVLDSQSLAIRDVVARGEMMMRSGIVEKKGYFE